MLLLLWFLFVCFVGIPHDHGLGTCIRQDFWFEIGTAYLRQALHSTKHSMRCVHAPNKITSLRHARRSTKHLMYCVSFGCFVLRSSHRTTGLRQAWRSTRHLGRFVSLCTSHVVRSLRQARRSTKHLERFCCCCVCCRHPANQGFETSMAQRQTIGWVFHLFVFFRHLAKPRFETSTAQHHTFGAFCWLCLVACLQASKRTANLRQAEHLVRVFCAWSQASHRTTNLGQAKHNQSFGVFLLFFTSIPEDRDFETNNNCERLPQTKQQTTPPIDWCNACGVTFDFGICKQH